MISKVLTVYYSRKGMIPVIILFAGKAYIIVP